MSPTGRCHQDAPGLSGHVLMDRLTQPGSISEVVPPWAKSIKVNEIYPGGGGGGGGGGYSSSSRAGRLSRTLWPQNSTSVAETEKGGQNSTMTPPTLEKWGQYSTSVWKVCKKGGQKSTILKNIGVKILQVWKWGSKFYMLKNRGQNSTMLEKRGVNILHPTQKVEVKILHRLKKGGQKGRAYPLPKI